MRTITSASDGTVLEAVILLLFVLGSINEPAVLSTPVLTIASLGLLLLGLHTSSVAWWKRERAYLIGVSREVSFAVFGLYVDSAAVYMVAVTNQKRFENITLQDNLHVVLKAISRQFRIFEIMLLHLPELYSAESIFLIFLLFFVAAGRRGEMCAFAVLARIGRVIAVVRLFRVLCYTSTVMPSQVQNCFVNRYDETYTTSEHWIEALTNWRTGGGCNDLIFSGHSVVLTLSALVYQDYAAAAGCVKRNWLGWFMWCRVFHAGLRIVYGQFHMTVDILVGCSMTVMAWRLTPEPMTDVETYHPEHDGSGQAVRPSHDDMRRSVLTLSRSRGMDVPHLQWKHPRARFWICTLTANLAFSFAMLFGRFYHSGPISIYNLGRMAKIAASAKDDSMKSRKSPLARRGYANAASTTWGRHCDALLAWDEGGRSRDEDVIASQLEPPMDCLRKDRWHRARKMWQWINHQNLSNYDWFVAMDDGGFPVPSNFLLLAETIVQAVAERRQVTFQEAQSKPFYILSSSRQSSAWGYVLNQAAARELVAGIRQAGPHCPVPTRRTYRSEEYSSIYNCLRNGRKVMPVSWDNFTEVRRALGCKAKDHIIVNLKAPDYDHGVCRHAVGAYFVASPDWMADIHDAVYNTSAGDRMPNSTSEL